MSQQHLRYRPEIDGLRMIAVLAVVLYHFGFTALSGGFAGVDVFFVISGYLIGGILWRELHTTRRINLANFYKRRVKRLAPAYFVMAFSAAIASWFILLPFEFREFGKSLIAATVYLSNLLFYRGEGYFDIGADSKVLLHTWSLSVEEQFYIFLPILLLVLNRWPRVLMAALAAGFASSLVACIWFTSTAQTATFYLFPFRAWELLAGVLLAVFTSNRRPASLGSGASWLGLALVLAGLGFIDASAGFPGWQAAIPVLGTALILFNGQHTNPVNRLLSSGIAVFFGKISYSLYLWHWPVFVLSNYWRDGYAGWPETALWLAVSIALATLSWRLIETPFRSNHATSGRKVLVALALPTAVALGLGALAYVKNGLPGRFPADTRAHIAASGDFLQDWSRCSTPTSGAFTGVELCPIGPAGAPEVLIWGDSHVRAIKEGLEQAAFEANTPALIIWHAGCPPLFDVAKTESYATPQQDAACSDEKARLKTALPELTKLKQVLLVGRWAYYAEGTGVGLDADNTVSIRTGNGLKKDAALREGFTTTIRYFNRLKIKPYVMQQLPEIPAYDSRSAARRLAHGHANYAQIKAEAQVDLSEVLKRQKAANSALKALPQIETWSAVCGPVTCSALHDGASWYFDNNHITNSAARVLSSRFAPLFENEGRP
ncbi:acyltransferase [Lentibacter algarum]|uniref:acyltransferase family protein n=1 Tax=Lentibacter algarum TaxID=576131 RepID=UPI001C083E76|nr:acyltransferase family protein [Lentibacter algarum]MBU2983333.1 acyltransferase [Lentibacter algarum]